MSDDDAQPLTEDDANTPDRELSIGERLRAARDAQSLSLTQISAVLRIETSFLTALEEDRLEDLPAPVFAKGFLKQYGSKLGLDERDLLAQYYRQVDIRDVPVVHHKPIRVRDDDRIRHSVAGMVVLLLISGGIAVWWFNQPVSEPVVVERSAAPVAAPVRAAPADAVAPEPVLEGSAPTTALPEPSVVLAPLNEPTVVVEMPVSTEGVQIELSFSEDCWAEVYDPQGERLFYGLGSAGARSRFTATLPVSIFFGNARGVELTLNGNPYPIPAESRQGNLARFEIAEPREPRAVVGLIQPVRGMNDVLPVDASIWRLVESVAREILDGYGYTQIRTPAVERTELFKRSIGEATDIVEKEMYTFEDRNGDSLTLRPEATAGIVRAGLSHGLFHNQQQKLWCIGSMFRHEKPQKARYRQFHQLSVEAIGFASPEIDAELIAVSARLWRELGLTSPTLELNSLGTTESRSRYRSELVEYFSRHREALDEDSRRRLETNPLRILDSKNPELAELIAGAPFLADFLDADSREHFEQVKSLLGDVGIPFVLNPRLVRGLDYYSRTVFEWVTDRLGAQSAICSGGRYDGLVAQLGGRETPASGWALGLERVVELLRAEECAVSEPVPDAYLVTAGDEARRKGFAIAETLRSRIPGLRLSMDCSSGGFKAQLRRADRSGARVALIIGEDELADGRVGVKPLRRDAPQTTVAVDDLVAELRRDAEQSA